MIENGFFSRHAGLNRLEALPQIYDTRAGGTGTLFPTFGRHSPITVALWMPSVKFGHASPKKTSNVLVSSSRSLKLQEKEPVEISSRQPAGTRGRAQRGAEAFRTGARA